MRAAVVGAGQISKQHLGALAACKGVTIVGVCDISPVMAEATAARFGIASWFTDYRRLLDEQRPDVVHILTPPATHFSIAKECLECGTHIFVEKPITEDFAQLEELIAMAAGRGKVVVEDHNYRFNRDVQHMLRLVESGRVGEVRHVDIDLCLAIFGPGSRFTDMAAQRLGQVSTTGPVSEFLTHLCYLAHAFIGDHRRVSSAWRLSQQACGPVVDNLQALVEGDRGTARLGFSADSQPDRFTVRVQGTRMQVETNLFEVGVVQSQLLGGPKPLMPVRNMMRRGRAEWSNAARSLRRKLGGGPGPYEGLWNLIRSYYDNLLRGVEPPVSTHETLAVNRLFRDIVQEAPVPCAC